MEVGLVVICGCCGKKAGESLSLDNENIEINWTELELWPNAKCVMVHSDVWSRVRDAYRASLFGC